MREVDSIGRQRRVTEDCKARERPNQFYVLNKTKLLGTRLEKSRRRETYQELFRQEMRRA